MNKLIMKLQLLIVMLIVTTSAAANYTQPVDNGKFKVIGYLFSHGDLDAASAGLDLTKITHLNIAFINPDSNGVFTSPKGLAATVKRAKSKKVKVLFSLAGGNPPVYLKSLLKDGKREELVKAIVAFIKANELDGIDVDLEGDFIDDNYEPFIVELAAVLQPHQKLLTSAVASWTGNKISDKALTLFSFINVMAYDHTGPWNTAKPGQHSSFEDAKSDFDYWNITRAIPASKLTLGLPFYGYGFGPAIQSDMTYGDIVKTYPGAALTDTVSVAGKGTIYYNGIPTITQKLNYAKFKKAGGVMIWQLFGDAEGENSLLALIQNTLK
jgi:chitinase